ncbi:MAG: hypothetical protein NTY12_05675 [Candidatus Falkowbacteria bacterium]|nr:hypothetical protein [Candidatus Falkowbacteria bacterium]
MQVLPHTELDDLIIKNLLVNGEQGADEIFCELINKGHNISLQAVYKRLRNLLQSGIILKNKQSIVISNEWKENLLDLLDGNSQIPKLKAGESAIYSFKELSSLDAYWKHIMAPLEKSVPDYPVFLFNPYEIWIQLSDRQQSEIDYLNKFSEDKRFCFFLLGKQNTCDQNFKKLYQSEYLQISLGADGFSERDYIAVISDYVITTKMSPAIIKTINNIYSSTAPNDLSKKIEKIFAKSAAIKLKIERNENKAKKLRKRISKDFYIPKELKEKFDLF